MTEPVKISSEEKTRGIILGMANNLGCYPEAKQILNKYDALIKNCTNVTEKRHMAAMGVNEINNLLDWYHKGMHLIGKNIKK